MRKIIFSLLIITLASCSYFKGKDEEEKEWTVEELYTAARSALDSGEYDKAMLLYEKLESTFPFGVYSQQTILDLAYAHYLNDEMDLSILTAERFIKLYPQNAHVDYAYYLKGLANFQRGKGVTERFLPIDESQRDSGSSLQAFHDFFKLVQRYPDSKYTADAKDRMVYLRNVLAQHEIHVAQYYMRRGAYVAAANRARYVVEKYARTPSVSEALVIMAKAYKIMELTTLSEDTIRVLELNDPHHLGIYETREIRLQ